jgi:hypothetical protein
MVVYGGRHRRVAGSLRRLERALAIAIDLPGQDD